MSSRSDSRSPSSSIGDLIAQTEYLPWTNQALSGHVYSFCFNDFWLRFRRADGSAGSRGETRPSAGGNRNRSRGGCRVIAGNGDFSYRLAVLSVNPIATAHRRRDGVAARRTRGVLPDAGRPGRHSGGDLRRGLFSDLRGPAWLAAAARRDVQSLPALYEPGHDGREGTAAGG